jgi:hypothetical protein
MCSVRTRDIHLLCSICSLFLIFAATSVLAQTAASRVQQGSGAASPLFTLSAKYYSGGLEAGFVTAADVNGDGIPDLLVTNSYYSNTVGVMLGNGYGAFLPAMTYDTGGGFPVAIVPIDVNGDGKLDLVVVNQAPCYTCSGDGSIAVLLGNGDGTFQTAKTYDSGGVGPAAGDLGPNPIAVVDLNRDGKLDVVVANCAPSGSSGCGDGEGNIGVLLGNGDGTFGPVATHRTGLSPGGTGLAVADLRGNGKLDAIVTSACIYSEDCPAGEVAVLLGNGNGTFKRSVIYPSAGWTATGIAVADLNFDGKLDLVVGGCGSSNCFGANGVVTVLLGNGDGTFGAPTAYDSGGRLADGLTLADVNGDGNLDIVVANTIDGSLGILEGVGDGTFLPPLTFGSSECLCYSVTLTDVNRDGKPDVVMSGLGNSDKGTIDVFINSATSTYRGTTTTLSSSLNPSVFGQSVTFTAQVTAGKTAVPNGEPVIFTDGKTTLASVPLSGGIAAYTTSSLSVKTHEIKATYTGDTWLQASAKTIKQVVEE